MADKKPLLNSTTPQVEADGIVVPLGLSFPGEWVKFKLHDWRFGDIDDAGVFIPGTRFAVIAAIRLIVDWRIIDETGNVIAERFADLDPEKIPAVLVYSHGPFTWGSSATEAVENMAVLEEVARMAWGTLILNPETGPMAAELLDKHFLRKHGADSYYGQS